MNHSFKKSFFITLAFFATLIISAHALCEQTKSKAKTSPQQKETISYMRVTRVAEKPRTLETVILSFASADGTQVDLVAAVHVGDAAYYQNLNRRFTEYDAVLFELVAPTGTKPTLETARERKKKSTLGSIQGTLGEMLGLAYQLEEIDYTAENFIHADLSPEEFAKRFQERGDLTKMLARALMQSMTEETKKNDRELSARLISSLFMKDKSLGFKRLFADMLTSQSDAGMWIIGGDESAIITDRNAACLEVLARELHAGKKRIAIFYGGAHLPEFAALLTRDFEMKLQKTEWIVAWDMQ